jgi:hypothetical protein
MSAMLNKKELKKIRTALPEDGYKRISLLMDGKSEQSIRMILTDPKRYNKDVIDNAILIVIEYKEEMLAQKKALKTFLA